MTVQHLFITRWSPEITSSSSSPGSGSVSVPASTVITIAIHLHCSAYLLLPSRAPCSQRCSPAPLKSAMLFPKSRSRSSRVLLSVRVKAVSVKPGACHTARERAFCSSRICSEEAASELPLKRRDTDDTAGRGVHPPSVHGRSDRDELVKRPSTVTVGVLPLSARNRSRAGFVTGVIFGLAPSGFPQIFTTRAVLRWH